MRTKYRLPCSCGERIAVEATQAGQKVRCTCGLEVEVPRMQRLRQLDQSPPEPSPTSAAVWNVSIGLMLFGAVILVAGGIFTYVTHRDQPRLLEVEHVTPWESWLMWQGLRSGVRLPEFSEVPYLEARREYQQRFWIGVAITTVGALIVVVSGFVGLAARPRAAPSRPRPGPAS